MSIPGSASPLFIGAAAGAAAAYQIDRSLRFNSADSAYLNRTPSSAGNRKTWTWSGWVKRSKFGTWQMLLAAGSNNSDRTFIAFVGSDTPSYVDQITVGHLASGIVTGSVYLNPKLRDPSAFFHLVIQADLTDSTANNRIKAYINGAQVDITVANAFENADTQINNTVIHQTKNSGSASEYVDAYLADVHFIDGQALAATDFGEFDSDNNWNPKAYSGSYGTNGFYLKFADNSSNAALGTDSSGNSNTWTVNNLSVASGSGNDSLLDTPTNYDDGTNVGGNYCTWNFLNKSTVITLSNGNLETSQTSTKGKVLGTIGVTSGKWYWEVTATSPGYGGSLVGIAKANSTLTNGVGEDANSWSYANNGNKYTNNTGSGYGYSYGSGDTIGVAFNADAGTLTFYKNGTSQGQAYSGLTSGPYFPAVGNDGYNYITNFGQRGSFIYTPPTGHLALCTTNLPDPTIADGSTAFDVALWTGNNSTQSLTGFNFSPDLFWSKSRSTTWNNGIHDIVRGTNKLLRADTTGAEYTASSPNESITSFNSDGVTFGADGAAATVNYSGTYVGWAWDAGTSTVSNTDGSITSSVRASQTNGISIVSFTGNNTNGATVGHGLNAVPEFAIFKDRDSTKGWAIYHKDVAPKVLDFTTAAAFTSQEQFNQTAPTSSVFTLGSNGRTNQNGNDVIAYCFAPVDGFSSVGSWTGNGSTDGPFVYTGHKVAWLMYKRTDSSNSWQILDTTRDPANVNNLVLLANSSNAESTGTGNNDQFDLLSNGFKVRSSNHAGNASGGTYIYLAFAEHPFSLNGGLAR